MKIIHLADLHLGKIVNNYSVLDDQKYILDQIVEKAAKKEAELILIAGDVFDSPVPSEEAVMVLNHFLSELRKTEAEVFLIAGNHDSGPRLEFGTGLLTDTNIHVMATWKGKLLCNDLLDRYGPLHLYALPYLTPEIVNAYIEDPSMHVHTATEAVRYAISTADIDWTERNILLAHQYVEGAVFAQDGSEESPDEWTDAVDPSVFEGFDYTALGHVHTPQAIGSETVRYGGTPLNYSWAEAAIFQPGFTLAYLGEKEQFRISTVDLAPLHPMVTLKGRLRDILHKEIVRQYGNCRVRMIVTDLTALNENDDSLKRLYPYVMEVKFLNRAPEEKGLPYEIPDFKHEPVTALFQRFYEQRNGRQMSEEQKEYLEQMAETICRKG